MPVLRMTLAISTLNEMGDIIWANDYEPKTAAALLKQMRRHLQEMIDDPDYPTLSNLSNALTVTGSETVRVETPRLQQGGQPAGLLR